MSSQEESDEYLDDIFTLIDFAKTESYEEYDVQDLITIEDEVIIDTSCNFNKKIFDEYINSIVKDTSILPYSFCKIHENLEFLDLCRPLSVRVTDCSKYPWYERDMAKIIYNKELEQNIQSKQNNKLLNYKFKEIIGKKYDETFDANNDTHMNNNSSIKILDIDDKEISDYLIRDSVIFDSINESQENYKESSLYCESDDFIIMNDKKEDHLFDNVNKPKRNSRQATSKTILEPCKKVDCISLSMDNKTQLIHSKKIVPHYHEKKDDKIIKTDLYLNEPKANCKVIKEYETCLNNMNKPENIQILNEQIFEPNQTPVAYPHVGAECNLAKYSQQAKKPKTKRLLIKQPKKSIEYNSKIKENKEKIVKSIKELKDKYFSNSASSVSTKRMIRYPSLPNVHTCVEFTPNSTQVCNMNISPNNLSLKGQNILTKNSTHKNNLLYPKSNSLLKSNQRHTPYFIPKVGNSYLPYNLPSITTCPKQIPPPDTLQYNLQTNYEPNQARYCDIGERKNDRLNTETLLYNKTETTLGVYQPYLYTSQNKYDRSKKNNIELGQRNSLKTSEKNNQQGQGHSKESETYTTVHKNGILIANNVPIVNRYQHGNKTSEQEIEKIKDICKTSYIEQGNNVSIESCSILKRQEKREFNNNVTTCIDQAFASISSNKIIEVQQEKGSTKSESKFFGISQQNQEQKQTYVYDKQQSIATTNNIHQHSHLRPPVKDDIFQNNKTVTGLERKQINETTTKSATDTNVHYNEYKKWYPCHGIDSISNAVNIRPNLKEVNKTGTGYSPPILPIPTYQEVFEVLAQVNLMSKFKRNLECRDSNGFVHDLSNEKILANRRITVDIQQYTKSADYT